MITRKMTQPLRVVLVHWNQPDACAQTIRWFLDSTVPVEVLVVDNGSEEAGLERLRRSIADIGDGARLVETGINLGFGPGANVGLCDFLADDTAGSWIALAPHDAQPSRECLEQMLDAAQSHPMAGLMCADVGDGMTPVIDPYFGGMVVPADPSTPKPELGEARWESVDYPHGTLMMLSRACLEEVGLFDERYFSYCEEAQLASRATAAGYEVGLIRGARVTNTHIGSGVRIVDYLQTRNTLLFVREHSGNYHAFIRLCIAIIQLGKGVIVPSQRPLIFDPFARLLGIRDYVLGRFGPP